MHYLPLFVAIFCMIFIIPCDNIYRAQKPFDLTLMPFRPIEWDEWVCKPFQCVLKGVAMGKRFFQWGDSNKRKFFCLYFSITFLIDCLA